MKRAEFVRRRKALGLTQAELASRAGTTVTTVHRVEAGVSGVSSELMLALADELEVETKPLRKLFAVSSPSAKGDL